MAVAAGLVLTASAEAVPLELTFTGTVTGTFHREGSNPPVVDGVVNGLLPGDSVSYTHLVDFDAQGFYTVTNGGGTTVNPFMDSPGLDDFYPDPGLGSRFPEPPLPSVGTTSRPSTATWRSWVEACTRASWATDRGLTYFGAFDEHGVDDNFDTDFFYVFGSGLLRLARRTSGRSAAPSSRVRLPAPRRDGVTLFRNPMISTCVSLL